MRLFIGLALDGIGYFPVRNAVFDVGCGHIRKRVCNFYVLICIGNRGLYFLFDAFDRSLKIGGRWSVIIRHIFLISQNFQFRVRGIIKNIDRKKVIALADDLFRHRGCLRVIVRIRIVPPAAVRGEVRPCPCRIISRFSRGGVAIL